MAKFDVFNGDADGICALHQLRLNDPAKAELVTGVKREIRLLERLGKARKADVTVLDISLHENREALDGLLQRGCRVRYFDHHFAGEIPSHPGLETHIEVSPRTCTSLLVDRHLGGKFRAWAVTGAFGDNLVEVANHAARSLNLTGQEVAGLRTLGELLNFNSYGETLGDLYFPPADLYRAVSKYPDPLEFLTTSPEADRLQRGYLADTTRMQRQQPLLEGPMGIVVRLPGMAWGRRMMGIHANELANENPGRAAAVMVPNGDATLRVSVRAPLASPLGADLLCRGFPTGGGRPNAAGITALPETEVGAFLEAFRRTFHMGEAANL